MAQDGSSPSDIDITKITNPDEGIEYCNQKIRLLEEMTKEARAQGDVATASRCQGHIVKLLQILQYFIHQNYQQGNTKQDISTELSRRGRPPKKRFNA